VAHPVLEDRTSPYLQEAVDREVASRLGPWTLGDLASFLLEGDPDSIHAEVERSFPGSTALWFQSLGGVEEANRTFDISMAGMAGYASTRRGRYGLYFETGQVRTPPTATARAICSPTSRRWCLPLEEAGFSRAPDTLVVDLGRVRIGYRLGERLFGIRA
jgi:ethanolamine ammonia-lyase large subunit